MKTSKKKLIFRYPSCALANLNECGAKYFAKYSYLGFRMSSPFSSSPPIPVRINSYCGGASFITYLSARLDLG
jgi:hypothetical protein